MELDFDNTENSPMQQQEPDAHMVEEPIVFKESGHFTTN
jgi:hypothetical protein